MSAPEYDSTEEYCSDDIPTAAWGYVISSDPRPYKRCTKEHYKKQETEVAMIENNASFIIPLTTASITSSSSSSTSSSSSAESPTHTDCANHCGARLRSAHPAVQLDHNTVCSKHPISCFLCGAYPLTRDQLWYSHIAGGHCPNYLIYCSSFACKRKEDKEATKRWRAERLKSQENEASKKKFVCKKVMNRTPEEAAEAAKKAAGFVTFVTSNKYPLNLFGWGGCDLTGSNCSFAEKSNGSGSGNDASQSSIDPQQQKQILDFRNDHAHHTYARHAWETRRFLSQSCVNYNNDPNFKHSNHHDYHSITDSSSTHSCSLLAHALSPLDAKSLPPYSNVASLEVCPHCSVRMMVSFCDPAVASPTSLLHPAPLSHNDRIWSPYYPPDPVETRPFSRLMKEKLLCSRADFDVHVAECASSTKQLDAARTLIPRRTYLSTHRHIPSADNILRDVHTHEVYDQATSDRCGTSKFYPRHPDWNWLKSSDFRKLEDEITKSVGYSGQALLRTRRIQSHIVSQSSTTTTGDSTTSSSPVVEGATASPNAADTAAEQKESEDHDVLPVFWTYSQCLVQNLLLELGQLATRDRFGDLFAGRTAWTMRCEESDDDEATAAEERGEAAATAATPQSENAEYEEKSNQATLSSQSHSDPTIAATPAAASHPHPVPTPTGSSKYRRPNHDIFNSKQSRALEIMALTLFKQGASISDLILPYRTRTSSKGYSSGTGEEFDDRYYLWCSSQPRFLNVNEFLTNLSRLQRPLVYPFVEQVMIPDLANMVLEYF